MLQTRYLVTLDFETYFDTEYTLKKLTTTKYVRHELFLVHGVGVLPPEATQPTWMSEAKFRAWIDTVDWQQTAVLCHNTAFDGFILSQRYGVVPRLYLDTLSMARSSLSHDMGFSLDELARLFKLGNKIPNVLSLTLGLRTLPPKLYAQLGEYCCMDIQLAKQLFDYMIEGFPDDELKLIDLTLRCFCDPRIIVNQRLVKAELLWQERRRKRLLRRIGALYGVEDPLRMLGSNETFADMLREAGVAPPTKPSPTNPEKEIYAFAKTDKEFMELQEHPDDVVAALVTARLNAKSNIDRTRAQRMLEHSQPTLPLMYNYARAHTLRWSGGDKLNPQNFRRGGRLRRAMEAPPSFAFVSVDSGQIENRMTMMLAQQEDVLEAYRNKVDIYRDMAASIYQIPAEEVTPAQRFVGKVSELSAQYGCGAAKLQHVLSMGLAGPKAKISVQEAQIAIEAYRRKRSKVVTLWRTLERIVTNILHRKTRSSAWATSDIIPTSYQLGPLVFAPERVLLPNGLALFYRDLLYEESAGGYTYASGHNRRSKIYGGLLLENIVQCLSRILVGEQILAIAARYRVVLLTHDECGFLAPEHEADEAAAFAKVCFTTAPIWMPQIPLAADVKYAKYYAK